MENLDRVADSDWIVTYVLPWGQKIFWALVIFFIGKWIARFITKMMGRAMDRAKVDATLGRFLRNIAYAVLLAAVVLAALDSLGVNITSLLAILGAAGLAVGLALKDSLANFAAGVMLIIFRPFKVGDFVEAGGTAGVVDEIGVFSTMMHTPDNRVIVVPNGAIISGTITNVTGSPTRRIDLVIGIGYGDDIKKAKDLIRATIESDERILSDPAPAIVLGELGESSVNIYVRPWTKTSDFWATRCDLLENIKASFDANGISIPFPQRDVHLYQENATAS